ncbi:cytochrome c [Puniceicoccaceae bacterium K14]|nr:cytochrome c [Puniceicoccaceae bacterium K14]
MRKFKRVLLLFLATTFTCQCALLAKPSSATKIWKIQCASCHGNDGKGRTSIGKALNVVDLTTEDFQALRSDEDLKNQIQNGSTDDRGVMRMIPFNGILSEEEIDSLVAFIREFKTEENSDGSQK